MFGIAKKMNQIQKKKKPLKEILEKNILGKNG